MKQIILPSTILEFKWLVIVGFMQENGLVPSPKKDINFTQYRSSPRNLKFFQTLATIYEKIFLAPQKNQKKPRICGWVAYTMENKDTKADYQKVVRVRQ